MIRNLLIGASLIALAVVLAGSLESARIGRTQFARAEEGVPARLEHPIRRLDWQRDLVRGQGGVAAEQLGRMPRITSGK